MKAIFTHLQQYLIGLDKRVLLQVSSFMAILIVLNYTVGIEPRLSNLNNFPVRILGFFLLYFFVFAFAYWTQFFYGDPIWRQDYQFFLLLCLGPALFAIKISWHSVDFLLQHVEPAWLHKYLLIVVEWPAKCLVLLIALTLIWRFFKIDYPIAGMSRGQSLKPYWLLLLGMVPLIGFAATQPDFLHVYPKLKKIGFLEAGEHDHWWTKLIFELSYGTDFLSIETFFRGFLILGFVKYAGKNAILPMAAFYCSIHFGKPLLECISSYFGGIILGVVVYNSRSIWGGLLVHLGIAWLMEIAGYWGNHH